MYKLLFKQTNNLPRKTKSFILRIEKTQKYFITTWANKDIIKFIIYEKLNIHLMCDRYLLLKKIKKKVKTREKKICWAF
jgi:hypothetical protein